MKIVIIGAGGVIGHALFATLSPLFPDCIGLTTRNDASLTTATYDFPSLRPHVAQADVVIYCIGVTKFADCEHSPEKSLFLNAELPAEIIKSLSPDQTFIYFSSPLAFYDFKDATPSAYAQHKCRAEIAITDSGHRKTLIVRPSKIIESAGILHEWKKQLSRGEKVSAFFDQYVAPLSAATIAQQVLQLMEGGHTGSFNFSARDKLSYLDIAEALCVYFGLDRQLIEGKSAKEENAFFFEQDILDCVAAQKAIGFHPPISNDVVHDYFRKLV